MKRSRYCTRQGERQHSFFKLMIVTYQLPRFTAATALWHGDGGIQHCLTVVGVLTTAEAEKARLQLFFKYAKA